jgi:hypothetical protein
MPSPAPEQYFLSAGNPVANVDQRELEDLAMRVFELPEVRAARKRALAASSIDRCAHELS